LENSDKDFRIYTHLCYDRKVYGRKYTISAGRFISRYQLPRALLTRFLNKLSDGGYNNEIELLNKANKHKPPSPFPYGVDELFLNWPVYDWIKKRDFQVNILIDYVPAMLINYNAGLTKDEDAIVYQFYKTNDKKLIPKLIDIYRKKVPQIVDKYPCLQPLVDKLKNPSKIKNDFYERININSKDL
jgi:hypothetical protein